MPVSKITSKYQTTIPREVRKALGLAAADGLVWQLREGVALVAPASQRFLRRRGSILVGHGDAARDVRQARRARGASGGSAG